MIKQLIFDDNTPRRISLKPKTLDIGRKLVPKAESEAMMKTKDNSKSYFVQTYGCPMNVYDSEIISSLLDDAGYVPSTSIDDADVVIFNTCCIRENADQKVYGRLGDFKNRRDSNPNFVLVVAGCLVQKDKEALIEHFPHVDLVLGTHEVRNIANYVEEALEKRKHAVYVSREGDHLDLLAKPFLSYSAKVPISVGCNQWCTYCIVPYVRGPLKSRPMSWIRAEVQRLASAGCREITLLGQNVNDYGRDLDGDIDFSDVLQQLKGIPGLDRLRFTSPHPAYFTDKVIEAMRENPSVCEHVHLPLQSGDDMMLKKMRRRYSSAEFLSLVQKLRDAIPDVGITTDIITGFSDETEEQFEHTLDVVRAAQFDSAFMFAYSERPGTPGSVFPNQVPVDVRMDRLYRLQKVQNEISEAKHRMRLGREVEILVEGPSKKDSGRYTGRTRQNWIVHFPCDRDLTGLLVRVTLEEAYMWGFVGTLKDVL